MKILLAHNNYGKYSGEEAVVDKMDALFRSLGHEVAQLRMTTEGLRETAAGKVKGFLAGVYSPRGVRAMREALRREKPDVVNVHNLYPFISPAALFECRKARVPVVMTIHNFRLICPTGLFMRNGAPCEECLERRNEWGCVAHNCEQSVLKSAGYALRSFVARKTGAYAGCVSVFACITDFQRRKLVSYGIPAERIVVIPNSLEVPRTDTEPVQGDYVGFCGRLSAEKGVDLIIEAARRHPEIPFRLAGEVRDPRMVENLPANVELAGYVSGPALEDFYGRSRLMVMASRCYEGFPMSILEAARYRKAAVCPDHGGFTEIIGRGCDAIGALFRPGDANELEHALCGMWDNPGRCRELGERAYGKLLACYSADVVSQKWDKLVKSVVESGRADLSLQS